MAATAPTTETRGGVRVEHGAKRVRAYLRGELVADTTRPLLVWEKPAYPAYYIPVADVRMDLLTPDGEAVHSPSRGDGQAHTVAAGGAVRRGAALVLTGSPFASLRDTVRLDWGAMDAWFEEDDEVFTHPRDPYTRIDILRSSRHVRVEVDGVTVAESTSPTLLFETGLPVRVYLPKTHVRMDLLSRSERVTHCPYKGRAEYWTLDAGDAVHDDLAWSYPEPLPESQRIAGLIAFPAERVRLEIDGVDDLG